MLTDSSFQAVIQSNVAFIKAFAPWCGELRKTNILNRNLYHNHSRTLPGHCKKLAPTWGLLAQRFKDMQGVVIAELDCTVYPKICENVGVGGYPSLLLYKKGSKVRRGRI